MLKLPIGLQDFRSLREDGNIYVDKTERIYQLVNSSKYNFLSRPRRFGKSLLVNTLAELFQGNQELFQDLWVADQWNWQERHPIISLFFNSASYKITGLPAYISDRLAKQAELYGLQLPDTNYPAQLEWLIKSLSEKHGKVVLLIDEYDKPIIDYLHDVPKAEANRDVLKSFYSVLKPLDAHLRFVLITGVSKFSRVSIFSELNNLLDISLHPRFSSLLGYTQQEIEHYFKEYINQAAPAHGGKQAMLQQMALWYNGYSWDAHTKVYNPWSVLNFFSTQKFNNFWFESGTPTFLVKQLDKARTYDLEKVEVSYAVTGSFDLNNLNAYTLLFQTGYITIKAIDEFGDYTLGYPNREVRHALLQFLLAEVVHDDAENAPVQASRMTKALRSHEPEQFVVALNQLFASIPYEIFINDKEAYYHTVTFLAISLMGTHIQAEPSQAQGRPDCVVQLPDTTYIIEFKLNESAVAALQQIRNKQYATPYLSPHKKTILFGINLNATQKAIDDWAVEQV